jgi:23S rRNA pseudouridine1911/1915/1917 synthase
MAAIGHPVAGDPVYGPAKVIGRLSGQCLHASGIGFMHPAGNAQMEFASELPGYFVEFVKGVR